MFRFKIDVRKALKDAGYTYTQARDNGYINVATLFRIDKGECDITLDTVGRICNLTGLQPGDILEWVSTEEESERAAEVKRGPRKKRTPKEKTESGD